jgi:endonuclease/exonuclease/phosphatase family metal-dependent hydrolase
MTRRHLIVSLAMLALLGTGCSSDSKDSDATSGRRLRVMTYNIHHAQGLDQDLDLTRIAGVIKDAKPDLVALQEVDKGTSRSDKKDEPEELGALVGMSSAFAKAIDVSGGDYGNAVLSRWPILSEKVEKLPKTGGREQRVALITRVKHATLREIVFVAVHLEHQHEGDRLAQAKALKAALDQIPTPNIIVAGDFNATPDSEAIKIFTDAGWTDCTDDDDKTFPAPLPMKKIDFVLLPKGTLFRVTKKDVPTERVASDHRPVVVQLEWKREESK